MEWNARPGDRVITSVTKDGNNELVYLNGDHVISSSLSEEFLVNTGSWLPWSHQIIDYLSQQRGMDRQMVLRLLLEFEKTHTELDFDQLCILFLEEITLEQAKYFSLGGINDKCIDKDHIG